MNKNIKPSKPFIPQPGKIISKTDELETLLKVDSANFEQVLKIGSLDQIKEHTNLYNYKYDGGESPFYVVLNNDKSEDEKLEIIKYLDNFLNIHESRNDGTTLLHIAVKKNYKKIFKYLVDEKKFDINKQDISGKTPLMLFLKGEEVKCPEEKEHKPLIPKQDKINNEFEEMMKTFFFVRSIDIDVECHLQNLTSTIENLEEYFKDDKIFKMEINSFMEVINSEILLDVKKTEFEKEKNIREKVLTHSEKIYSLLKTYIGTVREPVRIEKTNNQDYWSPDNDNKNHVKYLNVNIKKDILLKKEKIEKKMYENGKKNLENISRLYEKILDSMLEMFNYYIDNNNGYNLYVSKASYNRVIQQDNIFEAFKDLYVELFPDLYLIKRTSPKDFRTIYDKLKGLTVSLKDIYDSTNNTGEYPEKISMIKNKSFAMFDNYRSIYDKNILLFYFLGFQITVNKTSMKNIKNELSYIFFQLFGWYYDFFENEDKPVSEKINNIKYIVPDRFTQDNSLNNIYDVMYRIKQLSSNVQSAIEFIPIADGPVKQFWTKHLYEQLLNALSECCKIFFMYYKIKEYIIYINSQQSKINSSNTIEKNINSKKILLNAVDVVLDICKEIFQLIHDSIDNLNVWLGIDYNDTYFNDAKLFDCNVTNTLQNEITFSRILPNIDKDFLSITLLSSNQIITSFDNGLGESEIFFKNMFKNMKYNTSDNLILYYNDKVKANSNGITADSVVVPTNDPSSIINPSPYFTFIKDKHNYSLLNIVSVIKINTDIGSLATSRLYGQKVSTSYIINKKNKLEIINEHIIRENYLGYLKTIVIQYVMKRMYNIIQTSKVIYNSLVKTLKKFRVETKQTINDLLIIGIGSYADKIIINHVDNLLRQVSLSIILNKLLTYDNSSTTNYAVQIKNIVSTMRHSILNFDIYTNRENILNSLISKKLDDNFLYAIPYIEQPQTKIKDNIVEKYVNNQKKCVKFEKEIFNTLIKSNLSLKDLNGQNALFYSVIENKSSKLENDFFREMLKNKFNPYEVNNNNKSILHLIKIILDTKRFSKISTFFSTYQKNLISSIKVNYEDIPRHIEIIFPAFIYILNHTFYQDALNGIGGITDAEITKIKGILNKILYPTTYKKQNKFDSFLKLSDDQLTEVSKQSSKLYFYKYKESDDVQAKIDELQTHNRTLLNRSILSGITNIEKQNIKEEITKNNNIIAKLKTKNQLTQLEYEGKLAPILQDIKNTITAIPDNKYYTIEFYNDVFKNLEIIQRSKYWEEYVKNEEENIKYIDNIHLVLHTVINKLNDSIFNLIKDKNTLKNINKPTLTDLTTSHNIITDFYDKLFFSINSIFNPNIRNVKEKKYSSRKLYDIYTYIYRTFICSNFYGTLLKELYEYVDGVTFEMIKPNQEQLPDSIMKEIVKYKIKNKTLEEYFNTNYTDYLVSILMDYYPNKEDINVNPTIDTLNDKVKGYFLENNIINFPTNSVFLTNITDYIFPYYKKIFQLIFDELEKITIDYEIVIKKDTNKQLNILAEYILTQI